MGPPLHVLLVDNYDSFAFNLVDEFAKRGCEVEVWRNSTAADVLLRRALDMPPPRLLVLSPGPGKPATAGSCPELVVAAAGNIPTFGVCLGHQVIVEAFGGEVGHAGEIVHGKVSRVDHDGTGLLVGLPRPLVVGRYHSLIASRVPDCLAVRARTGPLVMAVEHREHRVAGVQFHPESILTRDGGELIAGVVRWAQEPAAARSRQPARLSGEC